MAHDHNHTHGAPSQRRLLIAFCLIALVCAVELVGGIAANSLALLADSGHLFTDLAALGMTLFVGWVAARPATTSRTFGYYRAEILVAIINALLLLCVSVAVFVFAIRRLGETPEVNGGLTIGIAIAGLLVNLISIAMLQKGSGTLNGRAVLLELASDALGSLAVLISAVILVTTGFEHGDAIASLFIALLIIPRTWILLREAVDVLLEASPKNVDMEEVRRHIVETPGVTAVHDLHAWTIASGLPVLSAHVVTEDDADHSAVLAGLSDCLAEHFDIEHSTFQLELSSHVSQESTYHD